ncbi:CDP-alcohol phosphatidyltransferase family protein, partial [Candidatus Babeliales bacterium]|nr:CDP-alcohol phosphatidyltransferase family protein [Candidatus Babeliales bacterium]
MADEDGTMRYLPNLISLSRIILSFVSLTLLHSCQNIAALGIFTLAVLTDFYDG